MGRKKKKVTKLTEEEYKQYILRMKEQSLTHHHDRQNLSPAQPKQEDNKD